MTETRRRLAAIVVADVVGYSRLMQLDEADTLSSLKHRRKAIVEPIVRRFEGRIVKVMGDGVLMEFASAVNAVKAALEIQESMDDANVSLAVDRQIQLRIGVNLGDIVGEGSDIYGDGVNIAARLEALAEPGAICVSAKVRDEFRGKEDLSFEDMGEISLKNIAKPVHVFRLAGRRFADTPRTPVATSRKAVGRHPAVHQFERRSGAAVFLGRHYRGHHHRAFALPFPVRHRPELVVSISRQIR